MINQITNQKTVTQLTFISLGALLIGHMMLPKMILLNIVGIFLTSLFVFHNTLRKNDVFSFIMVLYFCSLFPYLSGYGGGFNYVALLNIIFFLAIRRRLPYNYSFNDKWLNFFTIIFVLSSVLGWFTNYAGSGLHLVFSVTSFLGIISLLLVSSRIIITPERIKIFLQLNFVLIIYSTIASINKYARIITFNTPMMPIYGKDTGVFEGGGIIGSSPLYGEHSMILLILFMIFLLFGNKKYGNNRMLLLGVIISLLNVFMSVSRSVFLLSLAGIAIIYLLQFKLIKINITKLISQVTLLVLFGVGTLWLVEITRLGYVFNRVDEYRQESAIEGGISIDRIIDGSVFGRKASFDEGHKRYNSKESWIIGFGWGTIEDNRFAYYVDPTIKQGSAHSQIFAVLFIFGWIGLIAYLGIHLRIIRKSFVLTGYKDKTFNSNRLFAYFSTVMLTLFLINEIKVDSISYQSYFGSTIILLGLAYANLNSIRYLSNHS